MMLLEPNGFINSLSSRIQGFLICDPNYRNRCKLFGTTKVCLIKDRGHWANSINLILLQLYIIFNGVCASKNTSIVFVNMSLCWYTSKNISAWRCEGIKSIKLLIFIKLVTFFRLSRHNVFLFTVLA